MTEPAMTHTNPTLTAQRSRSNRIQYAGCFVVFLLLSVYVFRGMVQQYSENPTNENLLLVCGVLLLFIGGLYWLAKMLVPKVEFFEDHLAARSLWGVSWRRSYQEISELAVKHQHLFITFTDQSKIALHPEEINHNDLARWLAERDVSAARDLLRAPRRTSEDEEPKQQAVEAAVPRSQATSGPLLTTKQPWSVRIWPVAIYGAFLLFLGYPTVVLAQESFRTQSAGLLFFAVFMGLATCLPIVGLVESLVPKKEFYEDHILVRSWWGRHAKTTLPGDYQSGSSAALFQHYIP